MPSLPYARHDYPTDATRHRRYSTNPTRRAWYAEWRARRWRRRYLA